MIINTNNIRRVIEPKIKEYGEWLLNSFSTEVLNEIKEGLECDYNIKGPLKGEFQHYLLFRRKQNA